MDNTTGGPWMIDDNNVRISQVVCCCEKIKIISLSSSGPLTGSEVLANARLIAAAPELLYACRSVIFDIENHTFNEQSTKMILEIIKTYLGDAINNATVGV